jgi:beta-glucosidase
MKRQTLFRAAAVFSVSAAVYLYAASQPKRLSSFDPQVRPLLAKMTLEEKIGQMTQPDQEFLKDLSDIEKYFIGSVLSGGGSDPKESNSLQAWTDLYDRLQQHTQNTRLKMPLLYGIDQIPINVGDKNYNPLFPYGYGLRF